MEKGAERGGRKKGREGERRGVPEAMHPASTGPPGKKEGAPS